ncbi:MAG: hypothetical protein KJ799_10020, partial [Bacteroidetes bacterium]|nr:hypothetical protein [Bacteroidota bacterium]
MKTYTFHSNARSLSRISIYLFLSFVITVAKINAQELTTPEGVKLLQNKSFNDDDEARGTILTLYKDL